MTGDPTPNTEDMQNDVAPVSPERTPGVRRLNRLPLYIGGSIAVLLLVLMTVALMNRTAIREATGVTDDENRQSAGDAASELTSGQPDGIISPETVTPDPPFSETVQTTDPTSPSTVTPTPSGTPSDDRSVRLASRIADYEDERMMQEMQLRDRLETDALNSNMRLALPGLDVQQDRTNGAGPASSAQAVATAGVAFPGLSPAQVGQPSATTPPPQGGAEPLSAADALAAIRGTGAAGATDPNNQSAKGAFLANAGQLDTSNYLQRSVQKPLSPYELKQGSVIPGVLVTAINSDLPGRIVGQVSRNVYDSTTGQYLLIPQGTKIFGRYDSDVSFGQQRVLVAWTRLIFPNGSSINIEGMAGGDQAGAGGFTDRVNNHWGRTLKSALLISVIGAGVENLTSSRDSDSVADAIRDSFGDTFSSVTRQSVERSLAVQPTLEIRSGYRFLIVVDKDMVLKPYG